jgi:hypothetical protein
LQSSVQGTDSAEAFTPPGGTPRAAAAAAVNVSRQLTTITSLLPRVANGTNVLSLRGSVHAAAAATPFGMGDGVYVATTGLGTDELVVIAVHDDAPDGASGDASASSNANDDTPRAVLVSPLVGFARRDASSDGRQASTDGAGTLPDGALVWIALPVLNETFDSSGGGAACEPLRLFAGGQPAEQQTCVAGCCLGGECACRRGYLGARCEHELRCVLVRNGHDTFEEGACVTSLDEIHAGRLLCGCRELGAVGALRFRLTPPTNAVHPSVWDVIGPLLALEPQSWLVPLFASLLTLALALGCAADLRTVYLSAASPRLLPGLRPQLHATRGQECLRPLLTHLLTRTSLLRIWFVYPGHTGLLDVARTRAAHVARTLLSHCLSRCISS